MEPGGKGEGARKAGLIGVLLALLTAVSKHREWCLACDRSSGNPHGTNELLTGFFFFSSNRLLSSVKGTALIFSVSAGPVRAAFWGTGGCALRAGQRRKMLQASGYSLVLSLQLLLLTYDLFVNSFSELLRSAPVIQLVLFM